MNFGDPAAMTFFACEPGGDKRPYDIESEFDADDARAETEHVAVVVFA